MKLFKTDQPNFVSSLCVNMRRFRHDFSVHLENRHRCRFPELFGSLENQTGKCCKLTSFPFEAWTNRNNRLWWVDQQPCSKTSPSGTCPHYERAVCNWLSFSKWTEDQGTGSLAFNPWLLKTAHIIFLWLFPSFFCNFLMFFFTI